MFKIVWIINYCTFCLPLVPEGFSLWGRRNLVAKPRRCVEKRREKKSLPPISTSALLRPLACGIRFVSYCLLKDTVVESGHIGVLTSWVSYIQTFINPGILNYAQGFLRPWEKHVCHKSASLHWHFENRSVCNALFKQIIEARLSNISSAKPTSFPALPASTFMVLVIIRGLCLVM